jgi:hypothetical protein
MGYRTQQGKASAIGVQRYTQGCNPTRRAKNADEDFVAASKAKIAHDQEVSMRVRPFFWLLLAASCISVLVFAAKWQAHVPAVMQVHIEQKTSTATNYTTIHLHLADEQGVPIEAAQVFSRASMTNMSMIANQSSIRYLGQGNYAAQLRLNMAGLWVVTVLAQADGFDTPKQTLFVQVQGCIDSNNWRTYI